eukprot:Polyplicarium_translucidae@DN4278_c0_g1_i1.p2
MRRGGDTVQGSPSLIPSFFTSEKKKRQSGSRRGRRDDSREGTPSPSQGSSRTRGDETPGGSKSSYSQSPMQSVSPSRNGPNQNAQRQVAESASNDFGPRSPR